MYKEKFDLTGRTAVVTAGGRNIGLACAHALAESGAKVIITGRPTSETSKLGQAELEKLGYDVELERFDPTKSGQVNEAADRILQKHGAVDVLVCNAGMGLSGTPAEDVADSLWLDLIEINLHSTFWCCRAFGRQMLGKGSGAIVNIGSMSGTIVNKPQPQSYYNTAKAGVHHLTRSLAAEWADRGVRVNCVAPTYIDNGPNRYGKNDPALFPVWMEMTPMHRQGLWEEVAAAALFLACDASSLITGQILHTDGGYTLW